MRNNRHDRLTTMGCASSKAPAISHHRKVADDKIQRSSVEFVHPQQLYTQVNSSAHGHQLVSSSVKDYLMCYGQFSP